MSALNRTIENFRPDFVANAPSVDPIVEAMKRLNLGDVSRVVQEDVALQEPQAKSTTRKGKKRRKKAITEDVKAQRTEAAEHAREMFGQKGGAQKAKTNAMRVVVLLESQGVRPQRKMPVLNVLKRPAQRG